MPDPTPDHESKQAELNGEKKNPYNFSHTLFTKTNCMKRVEFHIKQLHPQSEEDKPDFLLRGIFYHKQLELALKGEPLQPWATPQDQFYFDYVVLPAAKAKLLPGAKFHVEMPLLHELLENVDAKGFLDLCVEDDRDGDILHDWKFTKSPWNAWKLKKYEDEQAWLYLWLYEKVTGRTPNRLEYTIFTFPEPAQVFQVPYDFTRCEVELMKWRSTCEQINSALEFEAFLATPSKWNCRFCEFRQHCPYSD